MNVRRHRSSQARFQGAALPQTTDTPLKAKQDTPLSNRRLLKNASTAYGTAVLRLLSSSRLDVLCPSLSRRRSRVLATASTVLSSALSTGVQTACAESATTCTRRPHEVYKKRTS